MINVTELEKQLIVNIAKNDYANGDPTAWVWSDCLNSGPNNIETKSISGMLKKDLQEYDPHLCL